MLPDNIPLFILFRALGIESDQDIIEHIVYDLQESEDMVEMLRQSMADAIQVSSERKALIYIGQRVHLKTPSKEDTEEKIMKTAKTVLAQYFLPHVGIGEEFFTKKAYFLGYMVNRLLKAALEKSGEDDRDHWGKKRLDTAGFLME